MSIPTNQQYPIWIDVNSGTWGDTSGLRLVPWDISDELEGQSDSRIANIGNGDGDNLETALNNAVEDYANNLPIDLPDVKRLYYAAEAILEALSVDPSDPCKLCDTSFGFHTSECATHDLNVATDAVAEWVR